MKPVITTLKKNLQNYYKMKDKEPLNVYNSPKFKELKIDSSNLVSIKKYKNDYNRTKPFIKPISKIF